MRIHVTSCVCRKVGVLRATWAGSGPYCVRRAPPSPPNEIIVRRYIELRNKKLKTALPPEPVQIRHLVAPETSLPDEPANNDMVQQNPPNKLGPRPSIKQLNAAMDEYRKHPWTVAAANLRDPPNFSVAWSLATSEIPSGLKAVRGSPLALTAPARSPTCGTCSIDTTPAAWQRCQPLCSKSISFAAATSSCSTVTTWSCFVSSSRRAAHR